MKNFSRFCLLAMVMMLATPALAQQTPLAEQGAGTPDQNERYERATAALDAGRYDEAIELYRQLIDERSARQDAALYWMAYAQQRRGDRAAALRTLARLESGFPTSAWLDDARYLGAEIRGESGQELDPEQVADEEMRLHALNALMHVDSERALPVLERILRGDGSPELKERALFILVQGNEAAFEMLAEIARNEEDGRLRRQALQHVGMRGGEGALELLSEVYASTEDPEIKEVVLHGFMMAGDSDRLMELARSEPNAGLRARAIEALAMSGAGEELWSLYGTETSLDARRAILHSMAMTGATDRLLQLVRTESDPELRRTAVEALIMSGGHGEDDEAAAEIRPLMLELFRDSEDADLRRAALQYFWMQEDVTALIELFEQTDDREMKRQIVEGLSMMDSPEAIDFLMRLIEQE